MFLLALYLHQFLGELLLLVTKFLDILNLKLTYGSEEMFDK